MADEPNGLDEIPLEQRVPWVRLSRGVGVAIDAKKLILAALGLVLFATGKEGLDQLFAHAAPATMSSHPAPTPRLLEPPWPTPPGRRADVADGLLSAAIRLAEPVRTLVAPFVGIFALDSDWRAMAHALLSAAWGTLVWGIFGGAIARIAVVQVARAERVGIGEALRFAGRKWLPLIGTPLCPLLGVAFFSTFCAAYGLLYRLPAPGPTVAGIFAVFPMLAGLVMAIILISLAAGWPLMLATVAAEGEDGFDALSRSFAYVNQRPGRYAAYAILAWGLGILGLIVVDLFARTTVHMAHWSLSLGAPADVLDALFPGGTTPSAPADRGLLVFWTSIVGLLAHAWIYGYFWTSAAITYLILRQDVDGTPWHAILPPERRAFEFASEPATPAEPAASDAPSPA